MRIILIKMTSLIGLFHVLSTLASVSSLPDYIKLGITHTMFVPWITVKEDLTSFRKSSTFLSSL